MLLPHNLNSGAKHFPLSSQRPFHINCSVGAFFILTRQIQYLDQSYKFECPDNKSNKLMDFLSLLCTFTYLVLTFLRF